MVFSSITFLFIFLPIFLVLYYIIKDEYRNALLFLGSLLFYSVGEPSYLLLMLFSILVNFVLGLCMEKYSQHKAWKLTFFILALCYDFGTLLFFKYTNFALENINAVLASGGSQTQLSLLELTLPLGISFYTFQIVSYMIDLYRGYIPAEHSFLDLGTYICMFPQLIAGPIIMYSDIHTALKKRTIGIENLDNGLKTFIVGLGYKVILANRIGILWNEICTIGFESISTPLAWLGSLAYSMQLYFDFCGYSLMAIGLGQMLGFHMPQNFNHPYTARSVTDFWHRWHITLGAWFKEYIYIPLGGNRRGKPRMLLNLLVVWFLVGVWHGAAWNFIIWGIMIFLFQMVEKLFLLPWLQKENLLAKGFSHLYMFFYILVSWTVFAISDLGQLGVYLARMFPFFGIGAAVYPQDVIKHLSTYAPLLILCLLFCTKLPENIFQRLKDKPLGVGIGLGIFWYAVYFLSIGINNPFLYFRF